MSTEDGRQWSRKQELYARLLQDGFVHIRNGLGPFRWHAWWRQAPWTWHRAGRTNQRVAEFLHNVPLLIASPEFSDGDFWWMNHHARTFFENEALPGTYLWHAFFSPTRQLFDLVPGELRHQLKWDGPRLPPMTPERQAEVDEFLLWSVRENSNVETLRHALTGGADINARDDQGRTAIQIAQERDLTDHVRVLREAGAEK